MVASAVNDGARPAIATVCVGDVTDTPTLTDGVCGVTLTVMSGDVSAAARDGV